MCRKYWFNCIGLTKKIFNWWHNARWIAVINLCNLCLASLQDWRPLVIVQVLTVLSVPFPPSWPVLGKLVESTWTDSWGGSHFVLKHADGFYRRPPFYLRNGVDWLIGGRHVSNNVDWLIRLIRWPPLCFDWPHGQTYRVGTILFSTSYRERTAPGTLYSQNSFAAA